MLVVSAAAGHLCLSAHCAAPGVNVALTIWPDPGEMQGGDRVLGKIAALQARERQTEAGVVERRDGTVFEPMTKNEREQLAHLIELRDMIRAELIAHGQIEA